MAKTASSWNWASAGQTGIDGHSPYQAIGANSAIAIMTKVAVM
jgi:hypothetical protein